MPQPHDQSSRHPPSGHSHGYHRGDCWPIAASCLPMLAGAAALVVFHRASVLFLITFAACTALLALAMAAIG
jgi:hypothetical protein